MRFETLAELKYAYDTGVISQDSKMRIDNDVITLYIYDTDDEDDDGECVFRYEDLPRYLLVEALGLLGIPAEQV